MANADKKKGDTVKYEGEEHIVTHVFNHGVFGSFNSYYDLKAKNPVKGTDYHTENLSVHLSELDEEK